VGTDSTQTLSNKTFSGATTFGSASLAAPSGSAPLFMCRAWVNFNGTGTVAIRASGNVSSITDNGTGDYTINFSNALPDANYAVSGFTNASGSGLASPAPGDPNRTINMAGTAATPYTPLSSSCRVIVGAPNGAERFDQTINSVLFFR
jgi:hypothetical protein